MNASGDAAEQIVRMSLQGVEVAARITGTAAKEIALLIIAALKSDNKGHLKLKGKERLSAMLKSGKPLEIYSVNERDLERFSKAAKEYGIVYCVWVLFSAVVLQPCTPFGYSPFRLSSLTASALLPASLSFIIL
ncbi:MAG: PcfB family protein [Oscillospiraceae bacterium]|nr:PcfB family protein [Oscillospiraceae bacterium]MCL2279251.1 PcfB family protein [Oscillospiraceae bacterium]